MNQVEGNVDIGWDVCQSFRLQKIDLNYIDVLSDCLAIAEPAFVPNATGYGITIGYQHW